MTDIAVNAGTHGANVAADDPFNYMNNLAVARSNVHQQLALSGSHPSAGTISPFSFLDRVFPQAGTWAQAYLWENVDPAQAGMDALMAGPEAMRKWAQWQLGVMPGQPLSFKVNIYVENAAPFAHGLMDNWDRLTSETMRRMPGEARRLYEATLNSEMHSAMQLAMLHDKAVGEYQPVHVQDFSADHPGIGLVFEHQLDPSVVAQAQAASAQSEAAGRAMQKQALDGTITMQLAGSYLSLPTAKDGTPSAGIQYRVDKRSTTLYLHAKLQEAIQYAAQFPEPARGGIVAIIMGENYARLWLAAQLGFEQGKKFEPASNVENAPHASAVVARWGTLSDETLQMMPEHLRKRYEPLANEVMQRALHTAMLMDRRTGQYQDMNVRDFSAEGARKGQEYKYFLTPEGGLGRAVIDDGDCVTDILLPIVGAVLMLIPGTQPIGIALNVVGAALTVALAVKNGIETGNWLGASLSIVASVAGLSGSVLRGFQAAEAATGATVGAEAGALAGTMGTIETVGQVAWMANQGYTFVQGLETGNPLAAIVGATGIISGAGGIKFDGEALVGKNIATAAGLINTTTSVAAGVIFEDPLLLVNGLSSSLSTLANITDQPLELRTALNYATRGSQLAAGVMHGDGLGVYNGASGIIGAYSQYQFLDARQRWEQGKPVDSAEQQRILDLRKYSNGLQEQGRLPNAVHDMTTNNSLLLGLS